LKDLRIAVAVVGLAATVLSIAAWKPDSLASTSGQEGATEYVYESIINPPAFISPEFIQTGPVEMPSLNLTDAEIDALVSYLLEPQPPSP
jgi:hypothetical protein